MCEVNKRKEIGPIHDELDLNHNNFYILNYMSKQIGLYEPWYPLTWTKWDSIDSNEPSDSPTWAS